MWIARAGSAFLWNADRNAFEPAPPNANPLARLTLAESGPLRLTRADGRIEGALRVADLQGGVSWMPIDLSRGRFPFDVVRSVAVVGRAALQPGWQGDSAAGSAARPPSVATPDGHSRHCLLGGAGLLAVSEVTP